MRMPISAAVGHKPLELKEMQQKKPWTQPSMRDWDDKLGMVPDSDVPKAEVVVRPDTAPATQLRPGDRTLLNSYAKKQDTMNALGLLDSRANLARASALLKAEAWRRKLEDNDPSHYKHHVKRPPKKVESDYWDPTRLGAHLDHLTAVADAAASVSIGGAAARGLSTEDRERYRPRPTSLLDETKSAATPAHHPPAGPLSARPPQKPPTSASGAPRLPQSARLPARPPMVVTPGAAASRLGLTRNPPESFVDDFGDVDIAATADLGLDTDPRGAGRLIGADASAMLEQVDAYRARRSSSVVHEAGTSCGSTPRRLRTTSPGRAGSGGVSPGRQRPSINFDDGSLAAQAIGVAATPGVLRPAQTGSPTRGPSSPGRGGSARRRAKAAVSTAVKLQVAAIISARTTRAGAGKDEDAVAAGGDDGDVADREVEAALAAGASGAAAGPSGAASDEPSAPPPKLGIGGRSSSAPASRATRSFFPRLSGARLEELVRLQLTPTPLELAPTRAFAPPVPVIEVPTDPGPLEADPILQKASAAQMVVEAVALADHLATRLPSEIPLPVRGANRRPHALDRCSRLVPST